MKTLTGIALAALTAVVFSTPAAAQVRSEIELTRQQIQTERQALVTAGMELTDEEAAKFWPVYREYRAELAPIGDRQVELIMGYADRFGSVDDDYAQKMLDEHLNIQQAKLEVLRKYVPKFLAVLSAVKVARFYQIENKLDAVVAFDLAASIPVLQ
ncbi:MAG: hypothetical protein AMS20_07705 [Gemmatimonas sp. SG8_28]|jgi:Spy/CpxP family protein refolding chaperone|nr:MAG: hypothetical protein AMS20_07705 [Gemmatimonas sp. SG8_28]